MIGMLYVHALRDTPPETLDKGWARAGERAQGLDAAGRTDNIRDNAATPASGGASTREDTWLKAAMGRMTRIIPAPSR